MTDNADNDYKDSCIKEYRTGNELGRLIQEAIISYDSQTRFKSHQIVFEWTVLVDFLGKIMDIEKNRKIVFRPKDGEVFAKGIKGTLSRYNRIDTFKKALLEYNPLFYGPILNR